MNRFKNNLFHKFDGYEISFIENALWLAYHRYNREESIQYSMDERKSSDKLTDNELRYKFTAKNLIEEIKK